MGGKVYFYLMRFMIVWLIVLSGLLRAQPAFVYTIDLGATQKDQLEVRMEVKEKLPDTVLFHFPQIVPGTYSIYDFGRFVSGVKAFDKAGKELKVQWKDTNTWKISGAGSLDHIRYTVEDTWDTKISHNPIFEPAGTAFNAGEFFLLNHQGLFGYIAGYKFRKLAVVVKHPSELYGATGIADIYSGKTTDTFRLKNYDELIDSPILYASPDTATIMVGNTRVLIAVRAPGKKIRATEIAGEMNAVLKAQGEYLGGKLPVDKYAFLFCFASEGEGISGASGALEHCYSSVYFLPEMDLPSIKQMLRDVTAHEFFHIITPLTIHSEEIGDFSFNTPRMSKHLWLYEGCTEYAAGHVQVRAGLISSEEYLESIRNKMLGADGFNDSLPFTEMSKHVLTKYQKEYANVYQKGALIGMCLDILILHHSKGTNSLRKLLNDLGKMYGKDASFRDEELFSVIQQMTSPETGAFLKTYVEGSKPLPYRDILELAGIHYLPSISLKTYSFGGFSIGFNPSTGRLVAIETENMDEFGKAMGFKEGDELIAFNGTELTLNNVKDVLVSFLTKAKEGKKLKVVVSRVVDGKSKKVKLKGKIQKVGVTERHLISPNEDATPEQVKVRKAWLGEK